MIIKKRQTETEFDEAKEKICLLVQMTLNLNKKNTKSHSSTNHIYKQKKICPGFIQGGSGLYKTLFYPQPHYFV